jgi:glycosyltransferase involved in cell wall biosynthesis
MTNNTPLTGSSSTPSADDKGLIKDLHLIKKSGLFDRIWYEKNYNQSDILHYLQYGAKEGKNPNPYFDTLFYLKTNPQIEESGMNPLIHYILSGARENRRTHAELTVNIAQSQADIELLELSGLLDEVWYLDQYPQVRETTMKPAEHYFFYGVKESLNPNPYFDTAWYVANNPIVTTSYINPLIHYIRYGNLEKRRPHPLVRINILNYKKEIQTLKTSGLFDVDWYLQKYADVHQAEIDPVEHYYVHGASEGRNPNPYFETAFYLSSYPDAALSGSNPLLHYIRIGSSEHRDTHPSPELKKQLKAVSVPKFGQTPLSQMLWHHLKSHTEPYTIRKPNSPVIKHNVFEDEENKEAVPIEPISENGYRINSKEFIPYRVVYISGAPESTGHKYRVRDQLKALTDCKILSGWMDLKEVENQLHQLTFAEVIVLFRVPWSDHLAKTIEVCKKAGTLIVVDSDNIFPYPEFSVKKQIPDIATSIQEEKQSEANGPDEYLKTRHQAEMIISLAPSIPSMVKQSGIESVCIKNGFSEDFRSSCEVALLKKESTLRSKTVQIGFVVYSDDDQRNFKIFEKVLTKLFEKYPQVKLVIVGALNLNDFPGFKSHGNRIEMRPLISHLSLPEELIQFDINLIPPDTENLGAGALTELKYCEAALCQVPSIAYGSESCEKIITPGDNGYLVRNEDDWLNVLEVLILDPALRTEIGQNAHAHCIACYGVDAKKNEVFNSFNKLFRFRREKLTKIKSTLNQTITFIVPGMDKGGGGHAIVLDMAKWLAKWGHTVTISFTDKSADYSDPSKIESEFKFDTTRMRACFNKEVPNDSNITFSTFWTTVYLVEKTNKFIGRTYHMLLDYEPFFYPMCANYILALNSYYKKSFKKISWSPWIKNLLLKWHQIDHTRTFPLYFDRTIYNTKGTEKRSNKKIVFFGRPTMPRRCFDLGVEVLKRYVELYGDQVEIVFYGSLAIQSAHIPFKHTNLGVLTPLQLAELYKSASLGIAFSITNPSKVPFEMMACGLPIMDLNTEGNDANYGNDKINKNVFLVDPNVDEMAETINDIMSNEKERLRIGSNGNSFVSDFADEEVAAKVLFNYLKEDSAATEAPKSYSNKELNHEI